MLTGEITVSVSGRWSSYRSRKNGLALGRLGGVENQVAVAELGRDLGSSGFSGLVAVEAEQARVGGEGEGCQEQGGEREPVFIT